MKEAIVLSDGVIENTDFLKSFLESHEGAFLVCADGAIRHLEPLNRIPSVVIGDMDSADPDRISFFRDRGVTIITCPREKDKTDTHLAVELAVQRGCRRIFLFGALGGRIDHALANISLLHLAQDRDAEIRIVERDCELFLVWGTGTLRGMPGDTVSLLPLAGPVRGITLTGFQYALRDGTMEPGNPYGVSNRLTEDEGRITVREGKLLVIRYFRGVF